MTSNSIINSKWVIEDVICDVLSISKKTLREFCTSGRCVYFVRKIGVKAEYKILFDSLPEKIKNKFNINIITKSSYANSPKWAKAQADKYSFIIKDAKNLKGSALKEYLNNWNIENPHYKTSYSSFLRMKKRFETEGVSGLLAKYGNQRIVNSIEDDIFDYFKALYLKEGSPSLQSCWENTLGYAIRTKNASKNDFPSKSTFIRRLEKEVPKQSVYLARKGQSAWNRKYGSYIVRDYSTIKCGSVWVSDHAQIDIACFTEDGNVVFPWVTAWRDFKSGKWLGWILQTGNPNSDLIFQSFHYAVETYGLPSDVIIDNGKDYRSKDFAGGRKNKIKVNTDQAKTTSMLAELNVDVHFALPYNAQTKPIERDFLKVKELLSKHCEGYRGGNVVERPEKLAEEIKKGKILPFEKLKLVFDDFILNVLNKKPSQGKNLKGLSPDQLFDEEFTVISTPTKEALKLFCMRTSKNYTIGRNGINDRKLGIFYWADWLISSTGKKVYLRRDIQNYKEAWVFNADNDEFLGKVTAVKAVAALHADTVSKEEFKTAMANKKRNLKVAKKYIEQNREISIEEINENYKAAYKSIEKSTKTRVSKIANTNMDKVVRQAKEMERQGKHDLSMFVPDETVKKPKFYLFETDKIIEEELKGVAYGS